MPLSKSEAAESLREIEATSAVSARLRTYSSAAPHFMLWGLVWVAGYAFSAWRPEMRDLGWAAAIAVGVVGSLLLGVRGEGRRTSPARSLAISGAIAAFFGVVFVVLGPMQPRQIDAFFPLVFAGAYVLAGIWVGARFAICGVVVAAVTLAGYFYAGDAFGYWMAAAGGGTLLLTGLWLRSA